MALKTLSKAFWDSWWIVFGLSLTKCVILYNILVHLKSKILKLNARCLHQHESTSIYFIFTIKLFFSPGHAKINPQLYFTQLVEDNHGAFKTALLHQYLHSISLPPTLTYEEKTNYLLVCIICLIDTVCHHVVQKVALLDEAYCTEQLMPACTKKHHSGWLPYWTCW